jgi:flavin reductase (DIM6/NTAB) family NADH-FMN oxidoreductase RutF
MIDKETFRAGMARFATGVTVVTTRYDGRDYGMTLSALTSLCQEPPMLLICVNRAVPTQHAISASGRFVVNVLAEYQQRLARRFAKPAENKFDGVETLPEVSDLPVIAGTLAYFECAVGDRMTGGTHSIFVGEVRKVQIFDRRPLVFYSSGFGCLEPSAEQRDRQPGRVLEELADERLVSSATGPSRLGLHFWS